MPVNINGTTVKSWKFPAGEVGVSVRENVDLEITTFEARINNSDDLMTLILAKDAWDKEVHTINHLHLYYLPYAQQDRVCEAGESLSVKVLCNMINQLGFDSVTVYDCHSDVGVALLNNCKHVPVWDIFKSGNYDMKNLVKWLKYGTALVSPDAGANKKVNKVAQALKLPTPPIRADKIRDTQTGEILETVVYAQADEIAGKEFLIVDDICVGGATFIPIAQKLKEMGANAVSLYVTHGVFSKGVANLLNNGVDWIYTTNTRDIPEDIKNHKNVTVMEIV